MKAPAILVQNSDEDPRKISYVDCEMLHNVEGRKIRPKIFNSDTY